MLCFMWSRSESAPLAFAQQTNFLSRSVCYISPLQGTNGVIHCSLPLCPRSSAQRPHNDVLIMKLLGQQIAPRLIRMQWEIAAVLEFPPCCAYQAG